MANLTPCPFCGADIEDDSLYCDQCSNRLHRCPKCGRFCKGKFCPKCGCPTAPASETPAPAPNVAQPQPPVQSQAAPAARPTTNPNHVGTSIPGAGAQPVSRLVCRAMGVTLNLMAGAIVGRVNGNYASQLGTFQYLSGTQARLDFDGSRWTITDLGSRNGTAVNGKPCSPTQPFGRGDVIRFSRSYDFEVE